MRNNNLLQQFKRWGLKSVVSVVIFISVVLLRGVIITLALPSSLDEVKSDRTDSQLTAENWDYLVEQVKSGVNNIATNATNITSLSETISTNTTSINFLSGNVNTNTMNISNLSGKLATLSGAVSTLISNTSSSLRTKNGNNIYYTSGNVGIGTTTPTEKLDVSGNIKGYRLNLDFRNGNLDKLSILDTNNQLRLYGTHWRNYTGEVILDAVQDLGGPNILVRSRGGYGTSKNGETAYTSIYSNHIHITQSKNSTYKTLSLVGGENAYIQIPNRGNINDRSSCSPEGTIAFANRNNTNNSRLFVCEKVNGALQRVSLGGE